MTKEELGKLYDEWERAALASDDDNATGDDYFYHGASGNYIFNSLDKHAGVKYI